MSKVIYFFVRVDALGVPSRSDVVTSPTQTTNFSSLQGPQVPPPLLPTPLKGMTGTWFTPCLTFFGLATLPVGAI